jgi:adenylate cyclase
MSGENERAEAPRAPQDHAPAGPAAPPETPARHGSVSLPVLQKLKQNHVVRVALLYLGVSWIILEPVHVIFHMLAVPEWANRLVIVVMVLGFPLTVIPAWIYAATPATMKPEALEARRSGLRRMNRRLNLAIAAVAGIMVLYFLIYPWLGKHVFEPVAEDPRAIQNAPVVAGFAAPTRSIAVLPFADMSQGRDQQYLADGLADELLNLLAQIPELRVAARSSSFMFKDKPKDVATMATELKVAHLLEGSVRKAGNRVRITAQLIRADNGYELWSETFERMLDDIFQLQDEIAGSVVQALKVKLLGGSLPARQVPGNLSAYNLYLQGRFFAGQRTREGFAQALDYFGRAVDLDRGYEPSWTEQSIVYGDMAARGYLPAADALPKARDAVREAIKLNPKSARAHIALGYLHMNDDWDWAAADQQIGEALTLDPGSADVLHAAGSLNLVLGRVSESVRLFLAALARDPLRASSYSNLGVAYFADGRLPEAEQAFRKAIQLRPNALYSHNALGLVLLWKGDPGAALAEMKRETDEMWRLEGEALVYWANHQRAESDRVLAELTTKFQKKSPYVIATVYGYRGEADPAFQWLDRALSERDATLTSIKIDPLFQKIKADPRYATLLQKARLPL